jgi:hypothetical protein
MARATIATTERSLSSPVYPAKRNNIESEPSREPASDLEPLSCSSYERGRWAQGFAVAVMPQSCLRLTLQHATC